MIQLPSYREQAIILLEDLLEENYDPERVLRYLIRDWMEPKDALEALEDYDMYEN